MVIAEYFDEGKNKEGNPIGHRLELANRIAQSTEPWKHYNELKAGRVPPAEELINKIVEYAKVNLMHSAIISILYLTGSRVQEVTRYKYEGKFSVVLEEKDLYKLPIFSNDIWMEEENDGIKWIVIKTRIEKYKSRSTFYKQAYIWYDKENYLWPLIEVIESYLNEITDDGKKEKVEVCTISDERIRVALRKHFHISPHILRVWRAKHLVRYDNFDATALQTFFGWKTADLAMQYAASDVNDIKRRILGRI
jgi:integrase